RRTSDLISLSALDDFKGIPNRVRTGRASSNSTRVNSFCTKHYGHLSGSHIGNHHRDKKRTYTPITSLQKYIMLSFQRFNPTDSRADPNTDPISVFIVNG